MTRSASRTTVTEIFQAKSITGPFCCCIKNDLIISQNEKILSILKPSRGNFSPVLNIKKMSIIFIEMI